MVTICTASLTFSNSTFCPHSVFMCFVWISEQTAIISLYNINRLVCITETVFTVRYGLGVYILFRFILVLLHTHAKIWSSVQCPVSRTFLCLQSADCSLSLSAHGRSNARHISHSSLLQTALSRYQPITAFCQQMQLLRSAWRNEMTAKTAYSHVVVFEVKINALWAN